MSTLDKRSEKCTCYPRECKNARSENPFQVTKGMLTGALLKPDVPCEHFLRFAMNCLKDALDNRNPDQVSAAFRMICISTNSFPADYEFTLPIIVEQDDGGFHEKLEAMVLNEKYDELEKFVIHCCHQSIEHATRNRRE